jgi:hypothetical protein
MSANVRTSDSASSRGASRLRVVAALIASQLALAACGVGEITSPTAPPAPPAPKPITFDLNAPTAGGSRNASKSNLSGYYWAWDSQGGGRMFAETVLGLGINERAKVTSYVKNEVQAAPGRYRITAEVSWRGYLYGIGGGGTGSRASFVVRVTDGSGRSLVSPVTIAEKEVRESALTAGGLRHEGSATPVLEFNLPEGQSKFIVQFELTCETYGGFLSAEAGCLYGTGKVAKFIGLGGYARWTRLSVTSNP